MIEIKDLLARFEHILLSEGSKKESIINVLHSVVGVKIKNEDLKIKDNIIYLNIKPIYKSEIFMKKEKIAAALEQIFGEKAPIDLR